MAFGGQENRHTAGMYTWEHLGTKRVLAPVKIHTVEADLCGIL